MGPLQLHSAIISFSPSIACRTYTIEEVILYSYNFYYVEDRENSAFFSPYSTSRQLSPLPYAPSGYPDLGSEYRNEQENSKEKEEILEMYPGDIAEVSRLRSIQ